MITPAAILAILATSAPKQFEENPERFAVIAVAAHTAVETVNPRWKRGDKLLLAAILTAAQQESGFQEEIQSGKKRGKAGEICMMQIHPSNSAWKDAGAPSFSALGGIDLKSTTYCLTAGAISLTRSANYCTARNYRKNWIPAMWTSYHYGGRCWISPHAYTRTSIMWRYYSRNPKIPEEFYALTDAVQG